MSFTQHAFGERYKVVLSSVVASVGFLVALLVNSAYERWRDHESYLLMRHAIKVEAESNAHILQTAFRKYLNNGVVLQPFNTSVVAQMLYSPAFLKFSNNEEINLLSKYQRDIALANRYREKAEFFVFEDKDQRWLETLKPIWSANLDTCEQEIKLVIEQL